MENYIDGEQSPNIQKVIKFSFLFFAGITLIGFIMTAAFKDSLSAEIGELNDRITIEDTIIAKENRTQEDLTNRLEGSEKVEEDSVQKIIDLNKRIDDIKNNRNTAFAENSVIAKNAPTGNFTPTPDGGLDAFLEINGAEFVKEAGDVFRAVGVIHNVKPEMLVCIASADSSLGKHLKTPYNIGNVGNKDDGSTVDYTYLGEAANAMGSALNNQYMGGNNIVGELSGNGLVSLGADGSKNPCSGKSSPNKCYATSFGESGFWHKNVTSCLQNIYQDLAIDETFEFRT